MHVYIIVHVRGRPSHLHTMYIIVYPCISNHISLRWVQLSVLKATGFVDFFSHGGWTPAEVARIERKSWPVAKPKNGNGKLFPSYR